VPKGRGEEMGQGGLKPGGGGGALCFIVIAQTISCHPQLGRLQAQARVISI